MKALQAHYDGKRVCFDEPYVIQPNTPLVVVILGKEENENQQWYRLAMQGLASSYSNDEPDYNKVPLKEHNPHFKL